ncbi:MAG: archaeal heat shock protein Hsp20 [Promethearchaeota archaeon]
MTKKKRRIYHPFDDDDDGDDFFGDFFSWFNEDPGDFFNQFNKMFKNMMNNEDFLNFSRNIFKTFGLPEPGQEKKKETKRKIDIKGPFVYGFSVRFDENGKPIVDRFGNIKPLPSSEAKEENVEEVATVREPISDVIDDDNEFLVVVELPGVQKNDIELNATDFSIDIHASSDGYRKYHKHIELPAKINPDKAKARYNNGILEIRLEKISEKRKGSPIKIE